MPPPELPNEVVENLVQNLDLDTLKNLRLTNKLFSAQCLGPQFRSFVEHQTTSLTEQSLQSLHDLANHPQLRSAARTLTVKTPIYAPSRLREILRSGKIPPLYEVAYGMVGYRQVREGEEREIEEKERIKFESDLNWLIAQQEEQDKMSDEVIVWTLTSIFRSVGSLKRINLDVEVVLGPNDVGSTETSFSEGWRQIWIQASRTYRLTVTTIFKSGTAIDTLNVYRNAWRCSVPSCDIISQIQSIEAQSVATLQTSLTSLALSFSTFVETSSEIIAAAKARGEQVTFLGLLRADHPKALAKSNFSGIARLLALTPNLTSLDLHFFNTLQGRPMGYDKLFALLAQETQLLRLQKCRLGGFYLEEESLLLFLANHAQMLQDLELEQIGLTSGRTWTPIFKRLDSEMPALTHLRLSALWGERVQHLHPIWEPRRQSKQYEEDWSGFLCDGGETLVYRREFDADEIKKGLRFHPAPLGPALGSIQSSNFHAQQIREYGPPH